MSVIEKATAIVESCQSPAQLDVAGLYLDLMLAMYAYDTQVNTAFLRLSALICVKRTLFSARDEVLG